MEMPRRTVWALLALQLEDRRVILFRYVAIPDDLHPLSLDPDGEWLAHIVLGPVASPMNCHSTEPKAWACQMYLSDLLDMRHPNLHPGTV